MNIQQHQLRTLLHSLKDNFTALMDAVVRAKPSSAKGQYLKSVYLSPTMGPSVPVDPAAAGRLS